jgi:hypothetical protein
MLRREYCQKYDAVSIADIDKEWALVLFNRNRNIQTRQRQEAEKRDVR